MAAGRLVWWLAGRHWQAGNVKGKAGWNPSCTIVAPWQQPALSSHLSLSAAVTIYCVYRLVGQPSRPTFLLLRKTQQSHGMLILGFPCHNDNDAHFSNDGCHATTPVKRLALPPHYDDTHMPHPRPKPSLPSPEEAIPHTRSNTAATEAITMWRSVAGGHPSLDVPTYLVL